jgi:hypothetical protein
VEFIRLTKSDGVVILVNKDYIITLEECKEGSLLRTSDDDVFTVRESLYEIERSLL